VPRGRPSVRGGHLRDLPRPAVRALHPRRAPRRGESRRRERVAHLPAPRPAASQAGSRDARGLHVPRNVERFPLAARCPDRRHEVHASGRPREPRGRARPGHGAHDGGLGADGPSRAPPVSRAAAGVHRGDHGGRSEGMTRRRNALLALLLFAGAAGRCLEGEAALGAAWKAVASAGVEVALAPRGAPGEPGVFMTYDFHGGAGWAGMRREVALEFPDNWTLSFRVRGAGTANTLEVKFVDSSGENVWWARRENFSALPGWQTIAVKKRHVSFAWGPAGGRPLRRAAALEIVLSAGTGGKGFLEIADPMLVESPAPRAFPEPRVAKTPDGIALDLGGTRELSGLVVDWLESAGPGGFTVEISVDGHAWTAVRRVDHGGARRAFLHLPETEARLVRIALPPGDFGVPKIEVKAVEWAPTAIDF